MRKYSESDYNTGPLNLLNMERDLIQRALTKAEGSVKQACNLLKIPERTYYHLTHRHSIKREDFIGEKQLETENRTKIN